MILENFELFVIIFAVVAVWYSSIKHHKLKRRVELKERKRLEISKFFAIVNVIIDIANSFI